MNSQEVSPEGAEARTANPQPDTVCLQDVTAALGIQRRPCPQINHLTWRADASVTLAHPPRCLRLLPPAAMDADAGGLGCIDTPISVLSDDLLAQCFAVLDDGMLRVAAGTCRRWAALLRERAELFRSVRFDLPPKRSRGRDR